MLVIRHSRSSEPSATERRSPEMGTAPSAFSATPCSIGILVVHRSHIDALLHLVKKCSGDVEVTAGPKSLHGAMARSDVRLARTEGALTSHLDGPWSERSRPLVPRVRTLDLLRRAKGLLPKKRGVVRVTYTAGDKQLRFRGDDDSNDCKSSGTACASRLEPAGGNTSSTSTWTPSCGSSTASEARRSRFNWATSMPRPRKRLSVRSRIPSCSTATPAA